MVPLHKRPLLGLLCDDMGVGKTHQAMALSARNPHAIEKEGRKPHFLILCSYFPFWHWEEKLEAVSTPLSLFPMLEAIALSFLFTGMRYLSYYLWYLEK